MKIDNRRIFTHTKNLASLLKDRSKILKKTSYNWLLGTPLPLERAVQQHIPWILAVGGGKGGVGKTLISANIAAYLGNLGLKVLVVDMDLGGANLHSHFGLEKSSLNITSYISSRNIDLKDLLIQTRVEGVFLLAGGQEEYWTGGLDSYKSAFLSLSNNIVNAKSDLEFDVVVVDLGAGNQQYTMDFFSLAHTGLVVSLPESTSLENSYSFIKSIFWRIISNIGNQLNLEREANELLDLLFSPKKELASFIPLRKKILEQKKNYPELIEAILASLNGRSLGIVINQTRTFKDIDLSQSMSTICQHYFGVRSKSYGYLSYDEMVWKSMRHQGVFILDFPHSPASRCLRNLVHNLLRSLDIEKG